MKRVFAMRYRKRRGKKPRGKMHKTFNQYKIRKKGSGDFLAPEAGGETIGKRVEAVEREEIGSEGPTTITSDRLKIQWGHGGLYVT